MHKFIEFFLSIRDSRFFTGLVLTVIVASAIYAGASSYDIPNNYVVILDYFDYAITVFFLVEILIRIFAEANHPIRFFKNGWNVFDFIIVVVSLVPVDGAESAFVAPVCDEISTEPIELSDDVIADVAAEKWFVFTPGATVNAL